MSLVDRVRFAYKCPLAWDTLVGAERERYCGVCTKVVTNLSAMPSDEAERYLAAQTDAVCVRIEYGADGRPYHTAAAVVALAGIVAAGVGGASLEGAVSRSPDLPDLPDLPDAPARLVVPDMPAIPEVVDGDAPGPGCAQPAPVEPRHALMGKPVLRSRPEPPEPRPPDMGVMLPD